MTLLTARAEDLVEQLRPLVRLAAWIFVAYALARHVDWQDAIAAVLVARLTLVALEARGGRS